MWYCMVSNTKCHVKSQTIKLTSIHFKRHHIQDCKIGMSLNKN